MICGGGLPNVFLMALCRGLHTRRNRRRIGRRDRQHVEEKSCRVREQVARWRGKTSQENGEMMGPARRSQVRAVCSRTRHVPRTTHHAPRHVTPSGSACEDARRNNARNRARPWMRWAVRTAAVLAVGHRLSADGRRFVPAVTKAPSGASAADSATELVYKSHSHAVLVAHRGFMTSFRSRTRGTCVNAARLAAAGREPVTPKQLMLDSPAG